MPFFNCIYHRRHSSAPEAKTTKISFESSNNQNIFETTWFKALQEDSISILEHLELEGLKEFNSRLKLYGTNVLILAAEKDSPKILKYLLKDFHWYENTSIKPGGCVNVLTKAIECNNPAILSILVDKLKEDLDRFKKITSTLYRNGFIHSLHAEQIYLAESMTLALTNVDLSPVDDHSKHIIEEALEEASVCYEAHQSILSDIAKLRKEDALKFS